MILENNHFTYLDFRLSYMASGYIYFFNMEQCLYVVNEEVKWVLSL